jgi:hypothetical protein
MAESVDWEKRLWDLANGITGFAIVQSLLSGYRFGQPDFQSKFAERSKERHRAQRRND